MSKFSDFILNSDLLENLLRLGYKTPTPIQEKAIPHLLKGGDFLGLAQTGTGKTAAFSLPVIDYLLKHPKIFKKAMPRVLVLVPTRELSSQIHASIQNYAQNLSIKCTSIFGGVSQDEQVQIIRDGVDILVATPGRLLDLVSQQKLKLSEIEIFVIDEADRMLDMGFSEDLNKIFDYLPQKKQTIFFSATMPKEIEILTKRILSSPMVVRLASTEIVADNIFQKVIFCKQNHKFQLLKKILKEEDRDLVLVFTRTKNLADKVVEYLSQNRLASRALHGDKNQVERERAMTHFKEGAIKILVATDIASRGIDIQGVSHVINFDLPMDSESYIHRIGRTARAGKAGSAISFCDESEKVYLTKIQEHIKAPLKSEKFEGKTEVIKFKAVGVKKIPTPGKSQEKTAWLDHSKRQPLLKEGEKRTHPGFKKTKKKRK